MFTACILCTACVYCALHCARCPVSGTPHVLSCCRAVYRARCRHGVRTGTFHRTDDCMDDDVSPPSYDTDSFTSPAAAADPCCAAAPPPACRGEDWGDISPPSYDSDSWTRPTAAADFLDCFCCTIDGVQRRIVLISRGEKQVA